MIVSIPVVSGTYPVTAVGSPLKLAVTTSVVSVPVAEAVCADVQAAEEIAPVAKAKVPLATVLVIVAEVLGNVIVVESVPAKVIVLLNAAVFPFVTVNVPVLPVMFNPLILVWFASATAILAVGRTPVTPLVSGRPVAFVSTPPVGVPMLMFGKVVPIEGTPPALVIKTPLLAVARPLIEVPFPAYQPN